MDFRVLGPIEVSDGDRVIAVGGGQQRRLLAVLLANADRVVSLDRLVDCVWPDGAPPRTRRAPSGPTCRASGARWISTSW